MVGIIRDENKQQEIGMYVMEGLMIMGDEIVM